MATSEPTAGAPLARSAKSTSLSKAAAGKGSIGLAGENPLGRLMFYIPAAFMIVFFLIPSLMTIVWSFYERTMFWMEPGFTLFSYINFFTSARLENFLESIVHSAISVVICFVIGFPIAMFVRKRLPQAAQHRVILLFILPFMISEIIRIFMLRPILGRNGLINELLLSTGLVNEPVTWLLFSPFAVITGDVLSFMPFIIFAGFLAMEAVPNHVFDVCKDLGASRWRVFRDVILPLAAPGIFAGAVFIFVNGIGNAFVPNILGGPGAVNAGLIATQAIIALDFPLAMAISAIMILTLMGLLYLGHRLFNLSRVLTPIS